MQEIEEVYNNYYEALCDSDENRAQEVIISALSDNVSPEDLMLKVVILSIDKMNEGLVVNLDINLAQHYLSSKISEKMVMMLLEKFTKAGEEAGCVVIGTSVGDFHGLGKKIVISCLRANLFRVIDLGSNIKPEIFVDAALSNKAQVIAVSSMMAHTATGPEGALGVRKLLHEQNLEDRVKLIVGGAPYRFDHELYKQVKADGWGENGLVAVETVRTMVKEVVK